MKRGATACFVMLMTALTGTCCAHAGGDHQAFDEIARGRYLATVGDCAACHTVPGGKPYAGGLPIETPFGTLLGSNLTPDRETGIGAWTNDEFINAVKQGIGRNGKRLFPAMPYTYYTKLSRADVLAIRSYLETLEPVHNRIVSNQLPFPFNIRATMAVWNGLYFSSGAFKPDTSKSDDWNCGAHLVEGLAHCGMCHTAKNFLGGDKTSHTLEGGTLQGWFDPDLTNDLRTGLGNWSIDDIVSYLRTGHNQISGASGPMAEVIADFYLAHDRFRPQGNRGLSEGSAGPQRRAAKACFGAGCDDARWPRHLCGQLLCLSHRNGGRHSATVLGAQGQSSRPGLRSDQPDPRRSGRNEECRDRPRADWTGDACLGLEIVGCAGCGGGHLHSQQLGERGFRRFSE